MLVTIELPPDVAARLRLSLARQDAQEARRILVDAVAGTVEVMLREAPRLPDAEVETLFDEMESIVPDDAPVLSDEALSRAGIYQDHP